MRTCKSCHKPIEHLHGNQELCNTCQPKESANHEERTLYVHVPTDVFYKMKRNAEVGEKINSLTGEARLKMLQILSDEGWKI